MVRCKVGMYSFSCYLNFQTDDSVKKQFFHVKFKPNEEIIARCGETIYRHSLAQEGSGSGSESDGGDFDVDIDSNSDENLKTSLES